MPDITVKQTVGYSLGKTNQALGKQAPGKSISAATSSKKSLPSVAGLRRKLLHFQPVDQHSLSFCCASIRPPADWTAERGKLR
ncbi:MAG: hypothetical protein IIA05_00795 [Proteobacteria bacterium]|nr:hypothetical protein [Pseudomonadota bacterium]